MINFKKLLKIVGDSMKVNKIFRILLISSFLFMFSSIPSFAYTQPASVSTYAGTGELGFQDGEKEKAKLRFPSCIFLIGKQKSLIFY